MEAAAIVGVAEIGRKEMGSRLVAGLDEGERKKAL